MLADRRHSLRFILWTLLAVWVTASIAAGVTYLAISSEEAGEAHYRGHDYNRLQHCASIPPREPLERIAGFTPLRAGETALVTGAESASAPLTIYVRRNDHACVRQWSIEG